MEYVRERVIEAGLTSIGCYSGRGGEVYDPGAGTWRPVTKTEIKDLFRSGEVRVLIGTDSMSEGLNLQTCGRLINYDMPWNLMRVEQRIGRIDRIGSATPTFRSATTSTPTPSSSASMRGSWRTTVTSPRSSAMLNLFSPRSKRSSSRSRSRRPPTARRPSRMPSLKSARTSNH